MMALKSWPYSSSVGSMYSNSFKITAHGVCLKQKRAGEGGGAGSPVYYAILFIPNTILGSLQRAHLMDFVDPQHFPHVVYLNTQHRDTCGTGSSEATVRSMCLDSLRSVQKKRIWERGAPIKPRLVAWTPNHCCFWVCRKEGFGRYQSFSATKSQSDGNHFTHFFSKSSTYITGSF